jgi:hypothetical protein
MTFSEPNPDVRATGEEAGEFLDDGPLAADPSVEDDPDHEADPTRRPTGSPPIADDEA